MSPEASAEPGRWLNSRAPHAVAPMDALSPHDPCQEVTLMFASQTGKTEIILNFIGYIMDLDPGPILAIQPNQKPMGEAFSKDRIAPMIRDTPVLRDKVAAAKGRDSANTMMHKTFPGGQLSIGGSNSPAGLASRPIRYLLCDELDRWEVTKEGHALDLARKRTRTFHNRKILKTASPTFENYGIELEYQQSEQQFQYQLACPDCGELQFPQLRHFIWPKGEPTKAVYVCEHCGCEHSLDQEDKIKSSGEWVQIKDDGWYSKGFHMNQWASPFARWSETINEFLKAKDNRDRLQVVVNTAFAEVWRDDGEEIEPHGLYKRREDYTKVPEDGLVLVAGVDVQDDRIEMEVVAYGDGEESWGIDHRVIYGDPGNRALWDDLDIALQQRYDTEDGHKLHIAATCIDSGGHYTSHVYDFCKGKENRRIYPIKGVAGEGRAIVTAPRKQKVGKQKRGVNLFTVGVDEAKRLIYSRLNIAEPGPGYCHFPIKYSEEFFNQLTAEKIITRMVKGFPKREFVKTRPRNEALDNRAYALAALYILNPVFPALRRIKIEQEQADNVSLNKPRRRTRGGFVNGWK